MQHMSSSPQIVAVEAATLPADTPGITPLLVALAGSKGLEVVVMDLENGGVVGFARREEVEPYVTARGRGVSLLRELPTELVAPWKVPFA